MKKILINKILINKGIDYKIFFIFFFCIYEKRKLTITKNTKKNSKKKHAKDIKVFLKKKKTINKKRPKKGVKILLKKEKKKGISIIKKKSRSYLSIEEIII